MIRRAQPSTLVVAARRVALEELDHVIEGDAGLARDLLAAAQVFAV